VGEKRKGRRELIALRARGEGDSTPSWAKNAVPFAQKRRNTRFALANEKIKRERLCAFEGG